MVIIHIQLIHMLKTIYQKHFLFHVCSLYKLEHSFIVLIISTSSLYKMFTSFFKGSVKPMYQKILNLTLLLAIIVVVLGAYTRLGDAGLGCPDWPGCYGELLVPDVVSGDYDRPLDPVKAWKEMIHRYAASILGLCIFGLFFLAALRKTPKPQSYALPSFLVLLVLFQGALGMWTVTQLVHPGIVSMHLMGGFATTALLFWLLQNQQPRKRFNQHILKRHKSVLIATIGLLLFQIFLGGWTSSNYASLSCGAYFPTCLGEWWPQSMSFKNVFFWGPLGVDYEFGVLEHQARSAIQMMHRIGALVVTLASALLIYSFRNYPRLKSSLVLIITALTLQIVLGILNVVMSLPMLVAVLHNAFALGLLLSLLNLAHKIFKNQLN